MPGLASAQEAPLAAEIEGRTDLYSVMDDGTGARMTVAGIPVVIDGVATIHSPSNPNLRDDTGAPIGLTRAMPLPSRAEIVVQGVIIKVSTSWLATVASRKMAT